MKGRFFLLFSFFVLTANSQSLSELLAKKPKPLQVGDTARDFILTVGDNSIRSFKLPQMKRITLLHFWNTETADTKISRGYLLRLLDHYENASFINASGFEIIAVAVQSDMVAWRAAIEHDSLGRFTHGMAVKGLEDDLCKAYSISSLPGDILIDEKGIVIAINPGMVEMENMLDERKNYQPIKKDISARLASASNKTDVVKYGKIFLFNFYGDSLAKSFTSDSGDFSFHDLKLNQDLVLKLDRQSAILTASPIALYTKDRELILQGTPEENAFVFNIPTRVGNELIIPDTAAFKKHSVEEIDVVKSLTFSDNGTKLTKKDEKELNIIVTDMLKNPEIHLDFIVHTDSKVDEARAMELTSNQVGAIKDYFQKKGLDLCHITGIAKGSSEMRKLCVGNSDCTEEDHKFNRRVEFVLYKELTD